MTCPECNGCKWVGGEVPRLCQTCEASGCVPEPDPFRREQEDQHSWVEAGAFFAICAALAESSGDLALVEMFRTLWEQATTRANELDETELDRDSASPGGELVQPPASVWRRP